MELCNYVIVDDKHNIIDSSTSLPKRVEIHSCAKPFQLLPVCLLGLDDKYCLTPDDLAIMSSSSIAQDIHVKTIESLMNKAHIQIDSLQLEAVAPTGTIAYANWAKASLSKSSLYHQCIGNHIAMFLAQRELVGDGTDYLLPNSAIQEMIFSIVKELFCCSEQDISVEKDNCGAPCYVVSLQSLAIGYCNLCIGKSSIENPYSNEINQIRAAFGMFPTLLEGDGCLSTIITSSTGLIGKTGSNGILGIGVDDFKYGMAIYSPSKCWKNVAQTAQVLLLRIGNKDKKLFEALSNVR